MDHEQFENELFLVVHWSLQQCFFNLNILSEKNLQLRLKIEHRWALAFSGPHQLRCLKTQGNICKDLSLLPRSFVVLFCF